MPSIINTNMASLNAQRNLGVSQSALATSLQRLSSGLRINSAKDDAAGMAISSRMTAQINGLNQAARNANDGVSLSQTAEGALGAISDNLQRMRELAVQAANGSNSAVDRASIQAEVSQLSAEIDRVASTTSFNGNNVLDGSLTNATFQIGANSGQNISVSITSAKAAAIGLGGGSLQSLGVLTGLGGAALATAGVTGNPVLQTDGTTITTTNATTGAVATGYMAAATNDGVSWVGGVQKGNTSALAAANAANAISNVDGGVTATALTKIVSGTITAFAGMTAGSMYVNGIDIGAIAVSTTATSQTALIAQAINNKQSQTGVTASIDASGTSYTLTAADGRNIDISHTINGAAAAGTALAVITNGFVTGTTIYGQVSLHSNSTFVVADGVTGTAAAQLGAGVGAATSTASTTGTGALDVSTAAGASNAITAIDAALASINSQRGALGAVQNRFIATVANLQNNVENLSAARSRIQDTDFAAETASLTRNQILQQAGTAMLAQANQLPQLVLSLLK